MPSGHGITERLERVLWEGEVSALNALHRRVQRKPKRFRALVQLHPGSILNGYQEGDISFSQAVRLLKRWKGAK